MPTLNLLDATAHVFQFVLVMMLMLTLLVILSIMFRGFFELLKSVTSREKKKNNVPEERNGVRKRGVEVTDWIQ